MYLTRFCPRPPKRALFCTSAIVLFQIGAAGAVDITVRPGLPKDETQVLTDPGDTLTVDNGGTIDTTGAGTNAAEAPEDDQTVNNFGTIDAGVDGIVSDRRPRIYLQRRNGHHYCGGRCDRVGWR